MADELVETMRQSAEFLRTVKAVTGEDDAQFSLASVRLQRASAEIARLRAEVADARELVRVATETTQKHLRGLCDAEDRAADARTKAVADVAAWLRDDSEHGACVRYIEGAFDSKGDYSEFGCIATALETGEWEK